MWLIFLSLILYENCVLFLYLITLNHTYKSNSAGSFQERSLLIDYRL